MNFFYRNPIVEASCSNSSAISVRDGLAAATAARGMAQNVRTMIVSPTGEVRNPSWNSVPIEIIPQETFAPSAAGNVHINWLETADAHVIKADVPGMRRQDLQVLVEGCPVLQISGERFETWPFDNVNRRQVERWIGGFMRRFRLPDNVVVDRISAELELGVLTITIPKLQSFPSVQWFIPIGTRDHSGRYSQAAEGSLTDAMPPRRASNSRGNNGRRPQITDGEDQASYERRPRASIIEVDENPRTSKQRPSQRRRTTGTGANSRRNSARDVVDSQMEEQEDPDPPVAADEITKQTTDLGELELEPEMDAPKEASMDVDITATVAMVLENMLQALETNQFASGRTKSSNQSRRNSNNSNTSHGQSSSETGPQQPSSRRASRRATQILSTTDDLNPPETSASTQTRSSRRTSQANENNLLERSSQTLENNAEIVTNQNPESGTAADSRRSSRRASQTRENPPEISASAEGILETLGNALQRKISQTSSGNYGTNPNVGQDSEERRTTSSSRSSRRTSQANENNFLKRNSQTPENSTRSVIDQNPESGTAADPRRTSRRASQTRDNPSEFSASTQGILETLENALERRISQTSSRNYDGTNPNVGQDSEERTTTSSTRSSRRTSQANENNLLERNSQTPSEDNTQNVTDQNPESRTADSRRFSRRDSQTREDPPEFSASTQRILETLGHALERRISQTSSENYDGTNSNVGHDSEERTTTSSTRSSWRTSQATENTLLERNSQTPSENNIQSVTDQNPESGTAAGSRRSSRRASQTRENPPETAAPANGIQDNESGIPRSRRDSRQASLTDENAPRRRSSNILTTDSPQPNAGQENESRALDSRRPSRRAYTEITDTADQTEASVPTETSADPPENGPSRRTSESGETDVQNRPSEIQTLLLNAIEKASSEAQAQSSRSNSQSSSRRNSLNPQAAQQP